MKKWIKGSLLLLLLSVAPLLATDVVATKEYNPFEEMQKMQAEMDAVFEKFHKKMLSENLFSKFESAFPASVAVDFKDMGDEYELKADIPGSDENEINITTKDGMLKIEAKSVKKKEEKGKDIIKQERFVGTYMRMVSLPKDADADKLKSNYKNGVLEISIPKKR